MDASKYRALKLNIALHIQEGKSSDFSCVLFYLITVVYWCPVVLEHEVLKARYWLLSGQERRRSLSWVSGIKVRRLSVRGVSTHISMRCML